MVQFWKCESLLTGRASGHSDHKCRLDYNHAGLHECDVDGCTLTWAD